MRKAVAAALLVLTSLAGNAQANVLNGCGLKIDAFGPDLFKTFEGRWTMRYGPGEMSSRIGNQIMMLPLSQGASQTLAILSEDGALTMHFATLGEHRLTVLEGGARLAGLPAAVAGRDDLPQGATVLIDEAALGRPPSCVPSDMLAVGFDSDVPSATGQPQSQRMELYIVDESHMSGILHIEESDGNFSHRLVTFSKG
ncbi:hypothetical protein PXK00_13895 [Phaeobacter sp. QD34_3]|uniref:hypothetical protein n=1 Tax=unclassified Phaeobacter TaxID=2621772 RepID=UPI00237FB192|nr:MULTISPECIES: hypothetical protein [unclassified Phaeobacter]MDE4134211.1 hypothetical protein [Phaeobacter sp. QD34_3]MDE4137866.1 hypothetical protein [Phaeobacter sp. QD34_24]